MKNKLHNRHIQMIALGGTIGTGFFLGTSSAILTTGPSLLLSYIIGGIIMYLVIRSLGEMTVDKPISGSYIYYAYNYINELAGFCTGWNSYILFILTCMIEVTAAATLLDYWFTVPHWLSCLFFLMIFGLINLITVRMVGELEFWLAGFKVFVIVLMIVIGGYLIFFDHDIRNIAIKNVTDYTNPAVFFKHGTSGFIASLIFVLISFCGSEFISIAAGDSIDIRKTIPKAINGVMFKIMIFYVLTIAVILLMHNFHTISSDTNPFTESFSRVGFHKTAAFINFLAIVASLSALNSSIYISSRLLSQISKNNHAPKIFSNTNDRSIPSYSTIMTVIFSFIIVIFNFIVPHKLLIYLFSIVVIFILLSWFMILLTQFYFRKMKKINKQEIYFKSILFPYSNIIIMVIIIGLIISMLFSSDQRMRVGAYMVPFWLLTLFGGYFITKKISSMKNL